MNKSLARTPLYEEHLALGARMITFAGWQMPVHYVGITQEHAAVRSSAGVFDISHMTQIRICGQEAFDYLQELLTNDLRKISTIGRAQYTLMCNEEGGIVDDLIIYHTGNLEYLLITNAATRQSDLDWIFSRLLARTRLSTHSDARRQLTSALEVVDESDRTALIALQGPVALDILRELAGGNFEVPARFSISEALLDTVPTLVARTGYTGEDGVEILCHKSHVVAVWRMLLSFPEVTPCGLGARDTLRLEMGYHLYGQDMDITVDPISAGLEWVVALGKGAFCGSEAIAKIHDRGTGLRLIGLTVEGAIPRPGMRVLHDGIEVGKVTSGTFSPTLCTGIAMAYVPVELCKAGTEVQVVVRKRIVSAVVTELPFVRNTSLSVSRA